MAITLVDGWPNNLMPAYNPRWNGDDFVGVDDVAWTVILGYENKPLTTT